MNCDCSVDALKLFFMTEVIRCYLKRCRFIQLGECQRRLVLRVGHQLNYEELYYTLAAAVISLN